MAKKKKNSIFPKEVLQSFFNDGYGALKSWRMHRKLSRLELAVQLAVTKKEVEKLESSSPAEFDKKTLSKLLSILNITKDQLVTLESVIKHKKN